MPNKYFAISDHRIICQIKSTDLEPLFIREALDKYIQEKGFDSWIELEDYGLLTIGGLR